MLAHKCGNMIYTTLVRTSEIHILAANNKIYYIILRNTAVPRHTKYNVGEAVAICRIVCDFAIRGRSLIVTWLYPSAQTWWVDLGSRLLNGDTVKISVDIVYLCTP